MLGKLFGAKKDASSPKVSAAASAETGDAVDPTAFIPADQKIVQQGMVWKLNDEGDPENPECWLKRCMWLTSAGGLFYYSNAHEMPLGRHVRGLELKPVQYSKNQFAFEVHLPNVGGSGHQKPTVLATDSSELRDEWIRNLTSFAQQPSEEQDELSPLEAFVVKSQSVAPTRSRKSIMQADLGGLGGLECGAVGKTKSVGPNVFSKMAPPVVPSPSPGGKSLTVPGQGAAHLARRGSQLNYAEKNHTALILDWDDTLFPTTWVREDCGLNWKLSIEAQLEPSPRKTLIKSLLEKLLSTAQDFFGEAIGMSNVFIVTLAKRPWVDISSKNFVPGLMQIVQENNIKIIYAQEYVTDKMSHEYAHGDEFKSSDQVAAFWTKVKAEAMSVELEKFHKESGITWKNVISMGDSNFERYGCMAAGEEYIKREAAEGGQVLQSGATAEATTKEGKALKLRTKTVKMLGEPTVEELTAELTLLAKWLPHMIRQDSGFDIEIDNTDDNAKLMALHKQITGEDEELSWARLAGVEGPGGAD